MGAKEALEEELNSLKQQADQGLADTVAPLKDALLAAESQAAALESEVRALKEGVPTRAGSSDLEVLAATNGTSLARLHEENGSLSKRYTALLTENASYKKRVVLLENVATVQSKRLGRLELYLASLTESGKELEASINALSEDEYSNVVSESLATRLQAQADRLAKIEEMTSNIVTPTKEKPSNGHRR